MNADILTEKHNELNYRCHVLRSVAPTLDVICIECGAPMEAALLSECGALDRTILLLRCPEDGSVGQLRFTRHHGLSYDPPSPGAVTVVAGQQGYQHAICACGTTSSAIILTSTVVADGELQLRCFLGCHAFDLATPAAPDFCEEGHRHG